MSNQRRFSGSLDRPLQCGTSPETGPGLPDGQGPGPPANSHIDQATATRDAARASRVMNRCAGSQWLMSKSKGGRSSLAEQRQQVARDRHVQPDRLDIQITTPVAQCPARPKPSLP